MHSPKVRPVNTGIVLRSARHASGRGPNCLSSRQLVARFMEGNSEYLRTPLLYDNLGMYPTVPTFYSMYFRTFTSVPT